MGNTKPLVVKLGPTVYSDQLKIGGAFFKMMPGLFPRTNESESPEVKILLAFGMILYSISQTSMCM